MPSAPAIVDFGVTDNASGPVGSAVASLETLKATIQGDTAELRNMQAALAAMSAGTSGGQAQIQSLTAQIGIQKEKLAGSNAEFVKLGGSFKNIKPPTPELAAGDDALKGFMETAKGGLGPMGGLFERFQMLKTGGPAAIFIAASVALIALGAAIISTTIEMMKFSLAMADAGLKQRLAFGSVANAAGVKELEGVVSRLSSKLPNTSAEIAKFAQKEYEAGKRGSELEKAVVSASLAAAGLGKNAKLGSEAAMKAMLPIETQMLKAKENWGKLFAGVKVEGFEKALKTVLDLLDENTSTGKGLKAVFEGLMNPLFDALANNGPFFKAFFKEVVIMALVTAIAVKQVGQALSEAFGGSNMSGLDMIQAGILAAKVVVIGLAVAVGVVVLVFVALAAALGGVVFGAIAIVVAVVAALGYAFMAAYNFMSSIEWGNIASGLIDGLVQGIQSGAGAVLAAVTALASGMTGAIKGALGIASPSKVFAELGGFTAAGMAEGIDDGAADVNKSVAKMVDVPEGGSKKGGGGGNTINITINAEGGKAEDIATACRKAVLDVLEGVAFSQGMVPA